MAAIGTSGDDDSCASDQHLELTVFSCSDCCIYRIPPVTSFGHRAELWDVDKWLRVRFLSVIMCSSKPKSGWAMYSLSQRDKADSVAFVHKGC